MKVMFFSKRQYTGKDLLDDRYGRLYEIPYFMSKNGNEILGICISYRKKKQGLVIKENNINWYSFNSNYIVDSIVSIFAKIIPLINNFKPDVIVGCSDSLNIILSFLLAKYFKVNYVVDLYDNFESFLITRIPVINSLFRYAVKHADIVVCVSQPLVDYVNKKYLPNGTVVLIENAVNSNEFFSIDKHVARKKLNLPSDAILIGTFGALNSSRNIKNLYTAYEKICTYDRNINLVLAGKHDSSLPKLGNVIYVGNIPYNNIVYFINSLDVAVICLKDSLFCRYCFPQKLFEILACKVPLVAANIGVMKVVLNGHRELLFNSENDLPEKLIMQINKKLLPDIKVRLWSEQAETFENTLLKTLFV